MPKPFWKKNPAPKDSKEKDSNHQPVTAKEVGKDLTNEAIDLSAEYAKAAAKVSIARTGQAGAELYEDYFDDAADSVRASLLPIKKSTTFVEEETFENVQDLILQNLKHLQPELEHMKKQVIWRAKLAGGTIEYEGETIAYQYDRPQLNLEEEAKLNALLVQVLSKSKPISISKNLHETMDEEITRNIERAIMKKADSADEKGNKIHNFNKRLLDNVGAAKLKSKYEKVDEAAVRKKEHALQKTVEQTKKLYVTTLDAAVAKLTVRAIRQFHKVLEMYPGHFTLPLGYPRNEEEDPNPGDVPYVIPPYVKHSFEADIARSMVAYHQQALAHGHKQMEALKKQLAIAQAAIDFEMEEISFWNTRLTEEENRYILKNTRLSALKQKYWAIRIQQCWRHHRKDRNNENVPEISTPDESCIETKEIHS